MMNKLFTAIFLCLISFTAFSQDLAPAEKGTKYGEKVSAKGAIPVTQLGSKMGKSEKLNTKVSGTVVEVCEKKGCFMKLALDNGESMMVTFKDYGFFVPTSLKGKTVVIDGFAKQQLLTVKEQKHYAEDAKKSAAEIEKITQPKQAVTFEAKGVLVM